MRTVLSLCDTGKQASLKPSDDDKTENGDGDVAQLTERRTGTPLTQVRFPGPSRDFSPRVNFQCRLFWYGVSTPPCAVACINICAHVNDPLVHVRVRWIMETLKHPACTVGWVARLCRSWFSTRKATRISQGRNPSRTIQLFFCFYFFYHPLCDVGSHEAIYYLFLNLIMIALLLLCGWSLLRHAAILVTTR